MTTKKYNMVATLSNLGPQTFAAVLGAAQAQFGAALDAMTAKQIAAVLAFGYAQHTRGAMTAE